MIQIPENTRNHIQQDSRQFFSRLICDGKEIDGSIRSFAITKGSCGASSFQPQSIFSSYADITLNKSSEALTGKKILLQLKTVADGADDWFTVATVYVSKPAKKGDRTNVDGLGVISAKLGKKFSGGTYTTVSTLLERLAAVAGCEIILEDGMEDLDIPETDLTDYYYREVLAFIAGLYFGYVTETADGNIAIKTFKSVDGTITAYPDRMAADPDFYDTVTVEGVQVIGANDAEFITGTLQNCSLTNPLMTETAFNTYVNNYVGFTYQPYDMELTLGDFTIEPWDEIVIEDREGVSHTLRPMNIKHIYDGGLRTTVSAPTLDSGEDYSRPEPVKQSTTAYNAYVSGNFGGGGSGGGEGISNIEIFSIGGTHISDGIGWIDSGGGQVFMSFNVGFPTTIPEAYTYAQSGTLVCNTTRDLTPYWKSYAEYMHELNVPLLYRGENGYYSAGGIAISFTIKVSSGTNSFTYTMNADYSNKYMTQELGPLYVYDSTSQTYEYMANTTFQINTSWLLKNVAT